VVKAGLCREPNRSHQVHVVNVSSFLEKTSLKKSNLTGKIIRVIQYGLGPIGIETARVVLKRSGLKLVGAVDIDPEKAGRDVGEVLGLGEKLGVSVSRSLGRALARTKADIMLHTTTSFLRRVFPELQKGIEAGLSIVSSSEELLLPSLRNSKLADRLDKLAKEHKVTVLGTGVNPGFVMDSLVLMMTAVCTEVRKIRVERVVDAGTRRLPLQRKVGAGITLEEFRERADSGAFGHIGLLESLALVAQGLGWKFDETRESLEPVVAERDCQTKYLKVKAGQVAGINHIVRGIIKGDEVLTLHLRMYVGAENPHDSISITGAPPVNLIIDHGIMGDTATVAMLVNAIPKVIAARPGLVTMRDLALPSAFLS
jgi:hypothetical protein